MICLVLLHIMPAGFGASLLLRREIEKSNGA